MKASIAGLGALMVIGSVIAAPVSAQVGGGQGTGGLQRRPAVRTYGPEFKAIVDAVAQKYQAKIVLDPGILVTAKPGAPDANLSLDAALSALAAETKGGVWRRLYLPENQAATLPPADKLAATARALELVQQTGVILENPATKKGTTFMKDWQVPLNFDQALKDQQFSPQPVYIIFSSSGDNRPLEDQYLDMQRKSMEMMMQMSPDELTQAMSTGMQMFMNMDPALRGQVMGNMMKAGMQMFMNMPADQRQQLMNDAMQSLGPMFGGGGQGGGRP